MMTMTEMIQKLRLIIGDPSMPFRTTALGDAVTSWFDLPNQQIQNMTVELVNGANYALYIDYSNAPQWASTMTYMAGLQVEYQLGFYTALQANSNHPPVAGGDADWRDDTAVSYTVNTMLGQVQLGAPAPNNSTLIIQGDSWSLFSDTELQNYCTDAVNQHCYGRNITERFYDSMGRIKYRDTAMNLSNLPGIEDPLVVDLATINVFYTMSTDTASSFNIHTAEGTNIDRSSQYKQIAGQISLLQDKYERYCAQLNVGMYRGEVMALRRTSLTTGRLVPVFAPAEYDDTRWPARELPPIDKRNEDNSGIPSPLWNYNGGI